MSLKRADAYVVLVVAAVAGAYGLGYWRSQPVSQISQSADPAPPAGLVGFEPAEVDLGTRLWGQVIPVSLSFSNGGDEPVVVASVKSNCGCTVVDGYEGTIVAPGDSLTVEAQLHTQTNPGAKVRRVTLSTEHGDKFAAVVRVDVEGTWSLSADRVEFDEVLLDNEESPAPQVVRLSSETDRFLGVEVKGAPWLEVRTADRDSGVADLLFSVVKEHLPPGVNTASVVVSSDNETKPAAAVYAKTRATFQLIATPEAVFLLGIEPEVVQFTDSSAAPASLLAANVSSDAITGRILEGGRLELSNPGNVRLLEPAEVRVTAENGISRTILVSTFPREATHDQ